MRLESSTCHESGGQRRHRLCRYFLSTFWFELSPSPLMRPLVRSKTYPLIITLSPMPYCARNLVDAVLAVLCPAIVEANGEGESSDDEDCLGHVLGHRGGCPRHHRVHRSADRGAAYLNDQRYGGSEFRCFRPIQRSTSMRRSGQPLMGPVWAWLLASPR